jgi:hypothetical protein
MKRKFLKVAKELGFKIISYKSTVSDMGCRIVDITVEKNGKQFSDDWGYWSYQKEDAPDYFRRGLLKYVC